MFHEKHTTSSFVREFIFGLEDGLITTLGIASGVGAAVSGSYTVILSALSGMFAGAISMAAADYLSTKSQKEVIERQEEIERSEMKNIPWKEMEEIEIIYKRKGFRGKLLQQIVDKITSNKSLWLKTMMVEELGVIQQKVEKPERLAFYMAFSFLIGGFLPLIPYFLSIPKKALLPSVVIGMLTLFITGAAKTFITKRSWIKSAIEMTAIGFAVFLVTYLIGNFFASL
jgi:predicted membrane protein (TIGR00267 family)